jgi:RNA polymerase subunit RPABC4/transcription elongation factor Spt4
LALVERGEKMKKKSYYCPNCKRFVKEWYVEPLAVVRGTLSTLSSGVTVKVCQKCNSVLMEFEEEK